jgi:AbrB family looped-hinge helix DNA binding protein
MTRTSKLVTARVRLNEQGRLVIPAELRAAAGLEPGSDLVLEAREGEVRIRNVRTAVARVQDKYRRLAKGRDLVDELLAERRKEAARD